MERNTRLFLAICSNIIEIALIILLVRVALPYWGVNVPVYGLALIILGWMVFSVTTYRIGSRALDQREVKGLLSMASTQGVVVKDLLPEGTVRIQGEYWRAYSEVPVVSGQKIEVVSQNRMLLIVRPVDNQV